MDWKKYCCCKRRIRVRVKFDKDRLKMRPTLPKRFCQVCSLREGSGVMITIIQISTASLLIMAILSLTHMKSQVDSWWTEKLDRDFKPWFGKGSVGYKDAYKHAWIPVAWTLVGICSAYLFCGFGVVWAVVNKKAHHNWCLPWLITTVILMVTSLSFIAFAVVLLIIFSYSREVTITADVVPPFLIAVFTCNWVYAFVIVLAHWKKTKRHRLAVKIMAKSLVTRATRELIQGKSHN